MWECLWKKSDVTPFVILNIFLSNCNLITHFFLVTVTNYDYFYFVIKLRNSITCNQLLPNTGHHLGPAGYWRMLTNRQIAI